MVLWMSPRTGHWRALTPPPGWALSSRSSAPAPSPPAPPPRLPPPDSWMMRYWSRRLLLYSRKKIFFRLTLCHTTLKCLIRYGQTNCRYIVRSAVCSLSIACSVKIYLYTKRFGSVMNRENNFCPTKRVLVRMAGYSGLSDRHLFI